MEYKPHLIPVFLTYFSFVWFFLISIFGKIENFIPSSMLALFWVVYVWIFTFNLFDPLSYVEMTGRVVLINASFALSFALLVKFGDNAWKHSLILCLSTFFHIMIIYSIKTKSYGLIYTWYDELITITILLHMVVSKSGFAATLYNIQGLLRRWGFNSSSFNKNIHTSKNKEGRT